MKIQKYFINMKFSRMPALDSQEPIVFMVSYSVTPIFRPESNHTIDACN